MTVEGTNFNGDTLSYTYDALKRLSVKSVVGQYRTFAQNYIYKTLVGTRTSTLISGLNVTLQGSSILLYTYSYDDLGNITGIYKDGVLAASYGYDDQGQLTSEIDHINDLQYIYVYDTYGNIRYAYKYTYSTATYLGTDTYGYTNTSWLDRLTSFNGANITYDAIGNPLSYNNGSAYTFTWQNGRDLASVVKGGVTTTYKYGADGQRIEKKYGSTTYNYYYADGLLVRQTWGNHYIDFLYDESGSPYSLIYDGVQYYYVKNVQGDVVQIRSSYGTLLVEYTYDAWGNVLSITGSNASVLGANNPIRYRSYYYDFETGFYYLNSRYYDPEIRRFINADEYVSTGQGFIGYNMYAYCLNNPVNRMDDSGNKSWQTLLAIGVSTVIIGLAILAAIPTGGGSLVLAGMGISAATATVAAQAVVVTGAIVSTASAATGLIESGITYATNNNHGKNKGQEFRGGSKKTRDKWYGYENNQAFKKWFERVGKRKYNYGMDIDCKEIADYLFQLWKELGSPFPK